MLCCAPGVVTPLPGCPVLSPGYSTQRDGQADHETRPNPGNADRATRSGRGGDLGPLYEAASLLWPETHDGDRGPECPERDTGRKNLSRPLTR